MDDDNKDAKVLTFLKKGDNDFGKVSANPNVDNPFGPYKYYFSLNSGFSCEKQGFLMMLNSFVAITDERGVVQFVVPWDSLNYIEKIEPKELKEGA